MLFLYGLDLSAGGYVSAILAIAVSLRILAMDLSNLYGMIVLVTVFLGFNENWSHSSRVLTMWRVPCLYF